MIHNIKLKLGMLLATLPLVLLMTSGSAFAANGCATSAEVTSLTSDEVAMVQLINNYRAQNSLSQLQVSKSLTCAARFMSGDMVAKNYFDHTEPSGRTFGARIAAFGYNGGSAGENIAAGYSLAQYTFDQWKNSPGHNQNMLYPSWQVIGIGKATGGNYGYYWTSDFGGTATSSDIIALPTTPPSDTTAPTTTLSLGATSLTTGQSTAITAAASENTGGSGLSKIELYQNNALVYQTSTSPLSYTFSSSTAGTYGFYAKGYDAAGNVATTSTQNITVTATTPPPPTGDTSAPSLTFTTSSSSVSINQVVTVKASATDNVGGSGLSKIELYQNNALLADGTGTDLNFYFASPVAGSFTFLAKAYDKSGNLTTSTGKVVTVTTTTTPPSDTTAPTASLSLSSTSVVVNTQVTATVTGSDNTGGSGLAKLELYRNGVLSTQTITSPLSNAFLSTTAGTYTFYAKAYDAAGNVTTTPTQTLTVTAATPPADTTAPSASLTLAATSTTTNAPVALSVSASDNTGGSGLSKIELYQNNSLVTQSTTNPLSYSFSNGTAGTYTFFAKVYDVANNQTTTATQSILVTSPTTTVADPPTNQSTADYEILAATNAGFTVKEGNEIYYKLRLKARPSNIVTLNLEGNSELYQKSPDDYSATYASFNSNNWNIYKYISLRAYVKDDINGDRLRTLTLKPNVSTGGVSSIATIQIKVTD